MGGLAWSCRKSNVGEVSNVNHKSRLLDVMFTEKRRLNVTIANSPLSWQFMACVEARDNTLRVTYRCLSISLYTVSRMRDMILNFARIDHVTSVVLYHAIWLSVHPRMFHKFSCYQIESSERNWDCLNNFFAVKRLDDSVTKTLSRNTSNSLSLGVDSSSRFLVGGRGSANLIIFCATSVLVVHSKCGSSQVIISTTKHPSAQTSVRLEQIDAFAASGANHLRRR